MWVCVHEYVCVIMRAWVRECVHEYVCVIMRAWVRECACMSMCVCDYACLSTWVCVNEYVSVIVRAWVRECVNVRAWVREYIDVWVCVHEYVNVWVCVNEYVRVRECKFLGSLILTLYSAQLFLWGGTKSTRYCDHFWHIVQTPDDRWGWLRSNWWNEDWQGKPKYSEKTCPSKTWSTTRTAAVGSQRITAWAMAPPCSSAQLDISADKMSPQKCIITFLVVMLCGLVGTSQGNVRPPSSGSINNPPRQAARWRPWFACCFTLRYWRCRKYVPPKKDYTASHHRRQYCS
jgi:hypothetical protein